MGKNMTPGFQWLSSSFLGAGVSMGEGNRSPILLTPRKLPGVHIHQDLKGIRLADLRLPEAVSPEGKRKRPEKCQPPTPV